METDGTSCRDAGDVVRLLDEGTANRIAAGEVVERPASIVKELVENALDAGATRISILIEAAGRQRIRVTDDGCGMSPNDAVLALQRHATSKISSADDLQYIRTLGFRGEALPSIASVSRVTVTTRSAANDAATRVEALWGDVEHAGPEAAPHGTAIDVRDLFQNTPARLKFLKSDTSELGRCVDAAAQLAIANPHVAFHVSQGGRELLATQGSGDRRNALAAVWGRAAARDLIPLDQSHGVVRVHGFIAPPDVSRPGRSHELIYVNGRVIRSRTISHALEEACRSLTPEARYPVAAVFVEIPPDLVDVNVHPTKAEVKFVRDGEVHAAVHAAVRSGLLAHGLVPELRQPAPWRQPGTAAGPAQVGRSAVDAALDLWAPSAAGAPNHAVDSSADLFGQEVADLAARKPFAERLREFRVLGQARLTYIVAATPDGLAIVDQHVAHERVLYERLTARNAEHGLASQVVAPAVTVTLGRREAMALVENLDRFRSGGWNIEPFGGESFVVRAVPALLASRPYAEILMDMLDEVANQSVAHRLTVQHDYVTITQSCKMAVKAGDRLELPEMEALLAQLADTENPYMCPHGRPIVITIPYHHLDRMFKRA